MVTFSLIYLVDQLRRTFAAVDQKQNCVLRCVAVLYSFSTWDLSWTCSKPPFRRWLLCGVFLFWLCYCVMYCVNITVNMQELALLLLCSVAPINVQQRKNKQRNNNKTQAQTSVASVVAVAKTRVREAMKEVKKSSAILSDGSRKGIRAADPKWWYYMCMTV